jgi:hypothetical protein
MPIGFGSPSQGRSDPRLALGAWDPQSDGLTAACLISTRIPLEARIGKPAAGSGCRERGPSTPSRFLTSFAEPAGSMRYSLQKI